MSSWRRPAGTRLLTSQRRIVRGAAWRCAIAWVASCCATICFLAGCSDQAQKAQVGHPGTTYAHDHPHVHGPGIEHDHTHAELAAGNKTISHSHRHTHSHRPFEAMHGGQVTEIAHRHSQRDTVYYYAELVTGDDSEWSLYLYADPGPMQGLRFARDARELEARIPSANAEDDRGETILLRPDPDSREAAKSGWRFVGQCSTPLAMDQDITIEVLGLVVGNEQGVIRFVIPARDVTSPP